MNKSGLILKMSKKLDQLTTRDVDLAIQAILETMSDSLAAGDRVEIRGFGSFANHYRNARTVRNPRTGEAGILKQGKYVPHFKPCKDLKQRVNASRDQDPGGEDCL
jgi:integration host factor subunit beta